MIRRAFAGLVTAAVLVFAPTAAMAYTADDYDADVSTTNPAPGESFEVVIVAPSGTDVTLTITAEGVSDAAIQIAGTKSLTKTAVDGQAVFTVTLTEEGRYAMVATAEDGTVIETFAIVVGDGVPGAGAPGDGGDNGAGDDGAAGPSLPDTGATATPLIIGGIALLLVGGAIVYLVRRRAHS
ncbi:LPXTG cell wall anchor domain-containing protein [Georgenia faecalis]|uniref:LPXTG cell wall anchor domain-containing protein n=1 Tax=Georgenia faecalis TaxID=2483799 RepID=UPI000FDBD74B|nr:LPXTG cell wall anchor domain-containing protein [Georgenia faecalis]